MFAAAKHLQAAFRLHNEIAYEYVRADLSKKEVKTDGIKNLVMGIGSPAYATTPSSNAATSNYERMNEGIKYRNGQGRRRQK
jgi:hypothetical protein